jgi:hypothetical protein
VNAEPFFTYAEPCENCGAPCDSRVWIAGFDYFACDDCAEEARIVIYAEDNCPVLYDAVMRSKHVAEVQRAFREHQAGCQNCNPARRKAA